MMADGADSGTSNGPIPVGLDGFHQEQRHPLKRIRPFFAGLVDGHGQSTLAALTRSLEFGIDQLEFIVVFYISHHGID